jgi:LPS export ABC transporter protein LptC
MKFSKFDRLPGTIFIRRFKRRTLNTAILQTKKLLTPHSSLLTIFAILTITACTFDYGDGDSENEGQPDIIMKDVEYVRMRDGYPVVRFTAEEAQRFEERQAMELGQFSFEQFETHAESVSATGNAGLASIELDSGDIHMKDGVRIEVESEDLAIATKTLEWQDKERLLSTGEADRVDITRSDGTSFTGWGFFADVRRRSWEFKNGVEGLYVETDEKDESEGSVGDDIPVGEEISVEKESTDGADRDITDKPAGEKPKTSGTAEKPAVKEVPKTPVVTDSKEKTAPAKTPTAAAPAATTPAARPIATTPPAEPAATAPAVTPPAAELTAVEPAAPAIPAKTQEEKTAEEERLKNLSAVLEGAK